MHSPLNQKSPGSEVPYHEKKKRVKFVHIDKWTVSAVEQESVLKTETVSGSHLPVKSAYYEDAA